MVAGEAEGAPRLDAGEKAQAGVGLRRPEVSDLSGCIQQLVERKPGVLEMQGHRSMEGGLNGQKAPQETGAEVA